MMLTIVRVVYVLVDQQRTGQDTISPYENEHFSKKSIPSIVFALLLQFPPFRNSDLGSHIRHFCPPPEASWSVKS